MEGCQRGRAKPMLVKLSLDKDGNLLGNKFPCDLRGEHNRTIVLTLKDKKTGEQATETYLVFYPTTATEPKFSVFSFGKGDQTQRAAWSEEERYTIAGLLEKFEVRMWIPSNEAHKYRKPVFRRCKFTLLLHRTERLGKCSAILQRVKLTLEECAKVEDVHFIIKGWPQLYHQCGATPVAPADDILEWHEKE